ncbi:MAG: hypothetical protein JWN25_2492 [Verrucomicrobiales bacterium]|nr:hypothetical protein [Verrucomicrobiales bacterium]
MRRVFTFFFSSMALLFCVLTCAAGDYATSDGQNISGQPISFTSEGVIIKLTDGTLSPRNAYTKFTQESLKKLSADSKSTAAISYIEPFLEEVIQERKRQKEIVVEQVPTIPRPEGATGLAALFSSPIGLMFFFVFYLANLHAGSEIGIYKNWPKKIALGASAILPVIAPVAMLCMPVRGVAGPQPIDEEVPVVEEPAATAEPENPALPDPGKPVAETSGETAPPPPVEAPIYTPPPRKSVTRAPINLPQSPANVAKAEAAAAAAASAPPADVQIFSRKDFTFNKRFFETKMPGFFRVVLSEADQQKVIYVKSARGNFVGQRITKVSPSDLTLQIFKENVTADESIPFNEIQEVSIMPRDSVV